MQPEIHNPETPATADAPAPMPATQAPETATAAERALLEDDLLVEDVSIDGMCGVY